MTSTPFLYHPLTLPAVLLFAALLAAAALRIRAQNKALAARLAASEQHVREKQIGLDAVVSSVGEGIIAVDESSNIESFNQAAATIFGYSPAEVIGRPVTMLMPEEMRPRYDEAMRTYLSTGDAAIIGKPNIELTGLRKDGSQFALELTVSEVRLDKRRHIVGVVRDITERKQTEERLLFLAQYDLLTGLPNRALFLDRLHGSVLRASRNRTAMAVMFLAVDHFRHINDTLGHHGGDVLLKQFGERLTHAVRKSDTVSRLAGDEFAVILEGVSYPIIDTRDVAEKILGVMQQPFDLGGHHVSITTSIGVAIHASNDTDMDSLLRRAADAMQRAKNNGRNRWSA